MLEDPAQKAKMLIIDVRDEDRAAEGWIPESYNWPTTELRAGSTKENEKNMEEFLTKQVQAGKTVLVYHCMWSQMRGPWACKRAIEAVNRNPALKASNIRNIILTGGFMEWRRQCPDLVRK